MGSISERWFVRLETERNNFARCGWLAESAMAAEYVRFGMSRKKSIKSLYVQ